MGGARGDVSDQLKQRRASVRCAGGEALVKLRLPGAAWAVRYEGFGCAAVVAFDPVRRPPQFNVGNQGTRGQGGVIADPRWATACRVEPNLVGEIGDQLRSCFQVGTPLRVVTEELWDRRKPRQWSARWRAVASKPGVEHGGSVGGGVELARRRCGLQCFSWVYPLCRVRRRWARRAGQAGSCVSPGRTCSPVWSSAATPAGPVMCSAARWRASR